MTHSSGSLHANAPSWLSHHPLQKSAGTRRTFLAKVHNEWKTEAMLLDIWMARGRSGSQDWRTLADDRWREKATVDFAGILFRVRAGAIQQKGRGEHSNGTF
jgi:hypothetical protein